MSGGNNTLDICQMKTKAENVVDGLTPIKEDDKLIPRII